MLKEKKFQGNSIEVSIRCSSQKGKRLSGLCPINFPITYELIYDNCNDSKPRQNWLKIKEEQSHEIDIRVFGTGAQQLAHVTSS